MQYIEKFKEHLVKIFEADKNAKSWHKVIASLIIIMIFISSIEIFLSTFNIDPELRKILFYVDIGTLVFFTIEVSCRIWVASMINPAYKGWKGRMKYIFTFNGFIDVISTYPFYMQWIFPVPLGWLRILRMGRTVRIFRLSRYMKSWDLLRDAVYEKRRELLISLQFLAIITFILSLILFFCEHDAQPDVYKDGFSTVAWSFAQYIGDPGKFGDTPPITVIGKIIACIVGLLGIAIVAVPAGILGSGFTEAMGREERKTNLVKNAEKLSLCFERQIDRPTGFYVIRPCLSFATIQARQGLNANEIIDVVNNTWGFRLINLADTKPVDDVESDRMAVEHYKFNKTYGYCIDRGSKVTIISPASMYDPCSGYFAYYLALIGGFNYISREFGRKAPYNSFYLYSDEVKQDQAAKEYYKDLEKLLGRENSWSFTLMAASGANEPEYDTQIHFSTGNEKGVETIGNLVKDKITFKEFYDSFCKKLEIKIDPKVDSEIKCDYGLYHGSDKKNIFIYNLNSHNESNHVIMRVAWKEMLWDAKRVLLAQSIAETINISILQTHGNPTDPILKSKGRGFDGIEPFFKIIDREKEPGFYPFFPRKKTAGKTSLKFHSKKSQYPAIVNDPQPSF